VPENANSSGDTSLCARAVAGSKHANPSAAVIIEVFTAVIILIFFSSTPLIVAFEFFILFLSACAVSFETAIRSMQRRSFVRKTEIQR
jgi:hypothetical protein